MLVISVGTEKKIETINITRLELNRKLHKHQCYYKSTIFWFTFFPQTEKFQYLHIIRISYF